MELTSTEGAADWEAAGEYIPDGMYDMMEFGVDDMEDGKPAAKDPPNDTAETDTPSPKQRDLSYFRKNEEKFSEGYDSDGESGPFIPDKIMVETVQDEMDIVPTLEGPPVIVTEMFSDPMTDTTKTTPQADDNPAGVFVNIELADILGMNKNTLENELYLRKEKKSGNKDVLKARLTTTISAKKPKFTDKQIKVAKGKKTAPEINPNNGLKSFPPLAYWRELKPNKDRVVEPLNPSFDKARAPTVASKMKEN